MILLVLGSLSPDARTHRKSPIARKDHADFFAGSTAQMLRATSPVRSVPVDKRVDTKVDQI